MLGRNYRFAAIQDSGVNCGIVIQARRWKFGTDGSITFEASETEVFNEATVASSTTTWTADTAIDNSGDKWIGAVLEVTVTPASTATANKVCTIEIQRSTDAGTTFGEGGGGETLGGIVFAASSSARTFTLTVD